MRVWCAIATIAAIAGSLQFAAAAQAAPPTCLSGTASGVESGRSLTFGPPPCTDPEGGPLTYTILTAPTHGTLTGPDAQSQWVYTANAGYEGADTITYKATDGEALDSNTATHTINVFNAAPRCGAPVLQAQSGTVLRLQPQCADPEGEPITITVTQAPAHGTFDPVAWTYTPAARYVGGDTFSYQASDGRHSSNVATAQINVVAAGTGNLPPPVAGVSVDLIPVSGTVLVRAPGQRAFRRLRAGEQLPVGTAVDVTHGRIRLTSAADASGKTQTADFYGGRFTIAQAKGAAPVTELRLDPPACGASAAASGDKAKKKKVNELWGDGAGRFRTRGRYGSAAVRGTRWLTRDQCDGTFFKAAQGVISVRDLVKRRTILLRAPKSYFAKKRR